jgi:hypothetical protein
VSLLSGVLLNRLDGPPNLQVRMTRHKNMPTATTNDHSHELGNPSRLHCIRHLSTGLHFIASLRSFTARLCFFICTVVRLSLHGCASLPHGWASFRTVAHG